jgi:hypothetical protein
MNAVCNANSSSRLCGIRTRNRTSPETFYRGDALVPGEYEESPGSPPVTDTSRRYILAIPESKVNDLRLLLKMAAHTFDQQAIYLSVAGTVEFVMPTEEDGYL